MRYVLFILCINLAEYIITQLHTVSTRSYRIWLVTLCCLCMKSSFCAELWNIYSCQSILLSSDSPSFILLHTGETDSASFERSLLLSIPEWTLINQKATNTHHERASPSNALLSLRHDAIHSTSIVLSFQCDCCGQTAKREHWFYSYWKTEPNFTINEWNCFQGWNFSGTATAAHTAQTSRQILHPSPNFQSACEHTREGQALLTLSTLMVAVW